MACKNYLAPSILTAPPSFTSTKHPKGELLRRGLPFSETLDVHQHPIAEGDPAPHCEQVDALVTGRAV